MIELQRGDVIAGKLEEILPHQCRLAQRARWITGGVLDADDGFTCFIKPRYGLRRHVHGAAARNVVDQNRKPGGPGDRLEMKIKAFLGGLVVIGGDHQQAAGARCLGLARQEYRFLGAIGAAPGDYRDTPRDGLDGQLHHPLVFGFGQARRLPGGAARNHAMGSFGHLAADQGLKRLLIHLAIEKRRNQRGDRSFEHEFVRFLSGRR